LRAVIDKERPSQRILSLEPSFKSQSSFATDLEAFHREKIAGGIADNLHLLPGRAGELGDVAKIGFQGFDFLHSTSESLDYVQRHPGDPASDWERTSIGLHLWGLIGPGELLPGVAGGMATVGDLAKTFGEAARSRILENRAERLINFGGAVPQGTTHFREEMESHYGYFSLTSDRYSAQGGWELRDSNERLFERDSQSTLWANTHVRGLHTANGSEISGIFRRSERREERGGSIFNLYEPTSITITRHSYDSYRVTLDSGHWNEGVETKTPAVPVVQPPNLAPPNSPVLPYRDETKKYLPGSPAPLPAPPSQPPPSANSVRPHDYGGISFKARKTKLVLEEDLQRKDGGKDEK